MIRMLKGLFYSSNWQDLKDACKAIRRLFTNLYKQIFFGRGLRVLRNRTGLKIHLGCGPRSIADWINVDLFPQKGAFFSDLRNPIELSDGCAAFIHCEHVLEHLARDRVPDFLRECYRILEKGGCLRIIVPDSEKYMVSYARNNKEFFSKLVHLGNATLPLTIPNQVVNQMFRMGGEHLYAWDYEELAEVIKRAGFERSEKSSGMGAASGHIDGTDDWRLHESLFLNALK